jgi:sulfoxide reductase heme-binding subunit YedZ
MSVSTSRIALPAPLRDHAGHFSWLKTGVLICAVLPALVLLLRWWEQDLGADPNREALDVTGLWTIRFLLLTLALTPARALLDWPRVLLLRRMLGVTSACYAAVHLTLFALYKNWDPIQVVSEIALRFYLTVGFTAMLGLYALAITSTDGWQRRLGRNWKRLHKLVFLIAVFALYHYLRQSKKDITDAVFLVGLFSAVMLWRVVPRRWQTWPLIVPALAVVAALITAATEALWYGFTGGINVLAVLQANLDIAYGPRPAIGVAIAGAAVLLAVVARRLRKKGSGGQRRASASQGAARQPSPAI